MITSQSKILFNHEIILAGKHERDEILRGYIELAKTILLKARDANKAEITSEQRKSETSYRHHGRIGSKKSARGRNDNRTLLKKIIQNEVNKRINDKSKLNGNQIKLISRQIRDWLCSDKRCDPNHMLLIDGKTFKVPVIVTIEGYIKEMI